ncbi:MAG: type II toxin-antitoxin system PemK/MazF family toxin [Hydrococcus sp. SU_1_0]|nr:type II toxin-antitoxin system PemK/MazF family toxin [Hydrococcus sp. SU_1_0]
MKLQRGEIIRVNLNPTEGREQQGNARPCLVLSSTQFNNRRGGIVIVSPITNTIKPEIKTLVQLPDGLTITGSVVAEQVLNFRFEKANGGNNISNFEKQICLIW